jgi:hypothetical protein
MSIKFSPAALIFVFLFGMCMSAPAGNSYEDLDKRIVEAYNANPKRTAEVYAHSMEMIEKSRRDGGREAGEWRAKAEKMVALACFYETTLAVQDNDCLAAFIWAKRGLANGASRGEIGGINIKDVNDFLINAAKELEAYEAVKKADFGKTKLIIADYRKTPPAVNREDGNKSVADPQNNLRHQLVAGPQTGAQGQLYVVVMANGSDVKIFYCPGKGWKADTWQPFSTDAYYKSWQEAAEHLAGSKQGENK